MAEHQQNQNKEEVRSSRELTEEELRLARGAGGGGSQSGSSAPAGKRSDGRDWPP